MQCLLFRMERPALFVGDAEEGAATLNEDEVRLLSVRGSCRRFGLSWLCGDTQTCAIHAGAGEVEGTNLST